MSCATATAAVIDERAGARAVARCDLLGSWPYSDRPERLYRGWLTPAQHAAQDMLTEWMGAAGMSVRRDPASNLIGRYEGDHADAPALLLGSHLDSVCDGGRYDGPLGILLGIECVASLHAHGRRLPFAIEVIAFGDEEGSRFPAAMFTSHALAGTLPAQRLDQIRDGDGISIAQALADWGLDPDRFAAAAQPRERVIGYLEAHIEQGPLLESEGLALGVVSAIAAQRRLRARVHGRAGHAGTLPMALRGDALTAAADCVLAVEAVARASTCGLVATVGQLQVQPGASNVVPGTVEFSLDVRAGSDAERDAGVETILARCRAIAAARGVTLTLEPVQTLAASPCDPALVEILAAAVAALGPPPRRLISGAGHDAMVIAALCPTAMLFVRCAGGISHHPAEAVSAADAALAHAAMLGFIERLANQRVAASPC